LAVFALYGLLPLLAYCVIQTFLDFRRKSIFMAIGGVLMAVLLMLIVVRVFQDPGR
jgi:hypothetical protein